MNEHAAFQPPNVDLEALCQVLTNSLHDLLMTEHKSEVIAFVGAYCGNQYSKYVGLRGVLENTAVKKQVISRLNNVTSPNIFRMGFRLGSLINNLQHTPPKDQDELQSVFEELNLWSNGGSKNIFATKNAKWKTAAGFFLKALEAIHFKDSILVDQLGSEPLVINRQQDFRSIIDDRGQHDPIFECGALCEEVIFPTSANFHYCWLPDAQFDDGGRYAVCLWSTESVAAIVEDKKAEFEKIIRTYLDAKGGYKLVPKPTKKQLAGLKAQIKAKINQFEFLTNENPAACQEMIASLEELKEAITDCKDMTILQNVFDGLSVVQINAESAQEVGDLAQLVWGED
jgi:hypothetical protein